MFGKLELVKDKGTQWGEKVIQSIKLKEYQYYYFSTQLRNNIRVMHAAGEKYKAGK
jgi:hypothetical protein